MVGENVAIGGNKHHNDIKWQDKQTYRMRICYFWRNIRYKVARKKKKILCDSYEW